MGASVRFGGLKRVREVVIEAVRHNGRALRFASEELKGDREVVIEAARQNGHVALHMCMTWV